MSGPFFQGGESGKDDADGVVITFAREVEYDPGTGLVPALDLNGTALVINQTDPTVTLGGTPITVLHTGDIDSTYQQVIVQLPDSFFAGDYRLNLQNTQGYSEFETTLGETASGGGSEVWVNFNGRPDFSDTTKVQKIRDRSGIASVTRHGSGRYNVYFSKAFSDIGYVMTVSSSNGTAYIESVAKSSIIFHFLNKAGNPSDPEYVMLRFIGN